MSSASSSASVRWPRSPARRCSSDDGAYDSDFGCVEFRDGRVVGVEFLPD